MGKYIQSKCNFKIKIYKLLSLKLFSKKIQTFKNVW